MNSAGRLPCIGLPCIGCHPAAKGPAGSRMGGMAGLDGGLGTQQKEDLDGKGPEATSASLVDALRSEEKTGVSPAGEKPGESH